MEIWGEAREKLNFPSFQASKLNVDEKRKKLPDDEDDARLFIRQSS